MNWIWSLGGMTYLSKLLLARLYLFKSVLNRRGGGCCGVTYAAGTRRWPLCCGQWHHEWLEYRCRCRCRWRTICLMQPLIVYLRISFKQSNGSDFIKLIVWVQMPILIVTIQHKLWSIMTYCVVVNILWIAKIFSLILDGIYK